MKLIKLFSIFTLLAAFYSASAQAQTMGGVYELRTYHTHEGKLEPLLTRFMTMKWRFLTSMAWNQSAILCQWISQIRSFTFLNIKAGKVLRSPGKGFLMIRNGKKWPRKAKIRTVSSSIPHQWWSF